MGAKKPDLSAALRAVPDGDTAKPAPRQPKASKPASAPKRERSDRKDTVMIGGHFPRSVKTQLRVIAAEEDTTSQALLAEALNLLFVKKGKAKIL